MANSDQINRLEERFDDLSDKIDKNHAEVTKALHEVELKVTKHESNFNVMKYIIPSGSILGIAAFFKDLFK